MIDRLPLARALHTSTKDLMNAFVGEEKRFQHPVTVELAPGVRALGFVTRETLDDLGIVDAVGVYLPQAYNFAGQFLIVPSERIQRLHAPPSDVMTLIVSGGVANAGGSRTNIPVVRR